MEYKIKEYSCVYDTPIKKAQELAVACKIIDLLNNNKYDSIEEFYEKNKNYQDFLKNCRMETAIKHFGNTLNEDDYINIINNLKVLTMQKQTFDENIKATQIENKEYNTYEGKEKTYFFENQDEKLSIQEQLKDYQNTNSSFQTNDPKQNTENMIEDMLETKKESLNLYYLNQINYSILNFDEQQMYKIALNRQNELGQPVRIDLTRGLIVDQNNNISKIVNENGQYSLVSDKNNQEPVEMKQQNEINHQKQLTYQKPSTIYTDNN